MLCRKGGDVYSTAEPAAAFHARTAFCLDIHNEVQALRLNCMRLKWICINWVAIDMNFGHPSPRQLINFSHTFQSCLKSVGGACVYGSSTAQLLRAPKPCKPFGKPCRLASITMTNPLPLHLLPGGARDAVRDNAFRRRKGESEEERAKRLQDEAELSAALAEDGGDDDMMDF